MYTQAGMNAAAREFFDREFGFFDDITAVSGLIRNKPLGPERKVADSAVLCCSTFTALLFSFASLTRGPAGRMSGGV
jgi:hypothetical protein